MKKRLEAELISIAHRLLKIRNLSEIVQLQEEVKKLYEQLTILRFYEENIAISQKEISLEELESKLEKQKEQVVPIVQESEIIEEELIQEKEEVTFENNVEEEVEETVTNQIQHEEDMKQPQAVLFEDFNVADYADADFVKVEDIPQEVAQVQDVAFETPPEPIFEEKEPLAPVTLEVPKEELFVEKIPEVVFEEPKVKSLNDRLNNGINFGLNDRIAFEKKLFGGSSDDFNRVVSQLNTFDAFDEAKEFITAFVKPDYDNWEGKEEYETRFLEIIEKKFN